MKKCALCGDPLRKDDIKVGVDEYNEKEEQEQYFRSTYHAHCFMDIVNSSSVPVTRTDITEGNLTLVKEEDGIKVFSPKAYKQLDDYMEKPDQHSEEEE